MRSVGAPQAQTAFEVAEHLRAARSSWDVFAERSRRYEIHLNGRSIEMVRGPVEVEGYGLQVFHERNGATGAGFQASTDRSAEGVRAAFDSAEQLAAHSVFPAKKVDLPGPASAGSHSVEIRDLRLWDDPLGRLQDHVRALLSAFDGKPDIAPSFGSIRATLTETTVANSTGLRAGYAHTTVDFEIAVKSFGGPEGRPPGEYWVNETTRRVDTSTVGREVEEWCRYARDVRRAQPTPSGEIPVAIPATVLSGILPSVIGSRFTGSARLREIAPALGSRCGSESLRVDDDGTVPWAIASGPFDDEGTPQARRPLIEKGAVSSLLYDALYAGAFDTHSTGNCVRGISLGGFRDWRRFLSPGHPVSSTVVVAPGDGGSDEEVAEAAGDGVWVQQLGWAIPDPLSGAFGGEVRIGYRIRHGKIAEPIRGGTVGGVVMAPPGSHSMLSDLAAIGSKPTLCEWVQSPTLLVRPLTVAGP